MVPQMPGGVSILDNMQRHAAINTPIKKMRLGGLKRASLLVSHEDRPLEDYFLTYSERQFGKCQRRFQILLLRDPYNWLASWYAWQDALGVRFREDQEFRNHTISLWKDYAQLYLQWAENPEQSTGLVQIPVSYNCWKTDQHYRQDLARELGLSFSDEGFNKVSSHGHGSSFSGIEYQGRGSEMDTLNRWRQFKNDDFYKNLLDDELRELGGKIFPDLNPDL